VRALARASLAAALLLGAAAAPAAAAWSDPERMSRGTMDATSPDVAVNARGDAAAAWVRGSGRARQIVATLRPLGGSWSRPEGISRRGRPSIDPRVAVGPDGRVVVVWRQVVGVRVVRTRGGRRGQAVYAARARERPIVAGRWEPVRTLSSPRQKVGRVFLGIDGRGTAVAAWHWGTGTRPADPGYVGEIQHAERVLGASWSAPRRDSTASGCLQVRRPRVAAGGDGQAAVWWQCDLGGGRSVAAAVAREAGEAFGNEARLPIEGGPEIQADMAIGPDGRAVAVSGTTEAGIRWWRGGVTSSGVALAELPALGGAERLSRGAGAPRIAVGGSGDALSAWIAPGGTTRTAPIAGDLGVAEPLTLGRTRGASRVRVAMGGSRLGAVAWLAGGRVLAVTRGADGNTSPRAVLSPPGVAASQPPALAMDTAGAAVALWSRRARGRSIVERAVSPVP
jgi:hypothetical protein